MFQLACVVAYCQPTKVYLSPKAAGAANQSTFVDSLKFYPLQVPKGVTIGEWSYPYITDSFFFVNNYTSKNLLVFKKDGRFVKEISYKKIGEYASPDYDKNRQQMVFLFTNKNYSLTQKDQIQIKSNFSNPRNKKYYSKYIIDLKDTSFAIKKADITAFDILKAYNLKDDYYCTYEIAVNEKYKDTTDYEVKIYKNTTFVKGYFPYNKQNEPRYKYARWAGAVTRETNTPNVFYITRPYVDTIYTLSDGIINPAVQLVLPMENSIPKSYFEKPFKNATERENFERNNGWLMRQIYLRAETDRFMSITISFFNNYGQYIYDKKINATYDINKIKPDSTLYNLPSLLSRNFNEGSNRRLYTLISSDALKKMYELKDKSAPYPKELEAVFKDPKNPSPIIVEFIIKNN